MTTSQLYELKYPIGEFKKPKKITKSQIDYWISDIEKFPKSIQNSVQNLSEKELNYNYRPGGWTIAQVVHHCADSHINSITRFKLALTEDSPTIRPYFEDRWSKLIDYDTDLDAPIQILSGIHQKLGKLLRNFSEKDLKREFIHPEHGKRFTLEETIGIYAWHSNHHLAHVKQALNYKGKF